CRTRFITAASCPSIFGWPTGRSRASMGPPRTSRGCEPLGRLPNVGAGRRATLTRTIGRRDVGRRPQGRAGAVASGERRAQEGRVTRCVAQGERKGRVV